MGCVESTEVKEEITTPVAQRPNESLSSVHGHYSIAPVPCSPPISYEQRSVASNSLSVTPMRPTTDRSSSSNPFLGPSALTSSFAALEQERNPSLRGEHRADDDEAMMAQFEAMMTSRQELTGLIDENDPDVAQVIRPHNVNNSSFASSGGGRRVRSMDSSNPDSSILLESSRSILMSSADHQNAAPASTGYVRGLNNSSSSVKFNSAVLVLYDQQVSTTLVARKEHAVTPQVCPPASPVRRPGPPATAVVHPLTLLGASRIGEAGSHPSTNPPLSQFVPFLVPTPASPQRQSRHSVDDDADQHANNSNALSLRNNNPNSETLVLTPRVATDGTVSMEEQTIRLYPLVAVDASHSSQRSKGRKKSTAM